MHLYILGPGGAQEAIGGGNEQVARQLVGILLAAILNSRIARSRFKQSEAKHE